MAFFYYVLCVLCLNLTVVKCIEYQISDIDSNFVVETKNSEQSLEHEKIRAKLACYCGPNSKSCKLAEGQKVCECNFKYRQVDGFCEPFCEKDYQCSNDARCVDESCQCLPGTKGDFCEIVDECEGEKGAIKCGDTRKINCLYDRESQKAFCKCKNTDTEYDKSRRRCVECNCIEDYRNVLGTCSLVDGKKSCKCKPGAAVKEGKCAACNCGNNSISCSFKDWKQVCGCKEGYYPHDGWSKTCEKCECGPHGKCESSRPFSVGCKCDDGYKPFLTKDRKSISCKECDCGGNGKCSFEEEVKKCECDKFFAEKNGKCVACQCYANDKTVECFFEGKIQHCLCPEGYENGTFVCKDINECLGDADVCPRNTYCLNTQGSFECPCVKGYKPRKEGGDPKVYGCEDIDECEIESMCPRVHTLCTNLPGTYKCECEWGYEPMSPYESAVIAGCQKKQKKPVSSPWKTAVIIVGVIFGLCIAGIGIAILIKRRSGGQSPRMDTVLQRMR